MGHIDLADFFDCPRSRRQRQYETVRVVIKDKTTMEEAARRFDYTTATVYTLLRDVRAGRILLFPEVRLGPRGRRISENLWTMVADTLYRRFTRDLRRFEHHQAPTIFKRLINMPGQIFYKDGLFQLKIRKRACTPIIMGVQKLAQPFRIPWLNNCPFEIV